MDKDQLNEELKEKLYNEFKEFFKLIEAVRIKAETEFKVKLVYNQHYLINLKEIFTRIYKDKYRIKIFHPIEDLSIEHQTGILIYWILKIKPFYIESFEQFDGVNRRCINTSKFINEYIAIMLLIHIIKIYLKSDFKPNKFFIIKLRYEFKYRNFTQSYISNLIEAILNKYSK